MSKYALADPAGPLAYLAYTYVHGGGSHSTVQILRELVGVTHLTVIDVYGGCAEYLADVEQLGVSPVVLFPNYAGRTTIGENNSIRRGWRMACAFPHLLQTAARLRRVLRNIRPRALWVDDEKALFIAWLALLQEPELPLAYFVRTELPRIRLSCALAWRRVDAALGVSADSLRYLRSTSLAQGNLHVTRSGIDWQATLDRARPEPPGVPARERGTMHVVYPAVFSPHKGHPTGIQAVARYVRAGGRIKLLLCGDLPPEVSTAYRDQIVELTHELGLQEHVHFLGWRTDVLSIMARADVVMLTSYVEGLPRSLLEAMTLGRPVLATRVSGTPELVRDGVDGLLVEPGDVDGTFQALTALSDPDTRERMGQAAQHRIRTEFTPARQMQIFLQVMNAICETRYAKCEPAATPLRSVPSAAGE
jgi:glycosyltransferase involved in cell wall biosynthesis